MRHLLRDTEAHVVNIDKLTYAANLASLPGAEKSPHYAFEQRDISDGLGAEKAVRKVQASLR